uniref:Major facilitator superfamily (MFS) profile domain-containing protein n=1 Tax=Chenopodium quinoa TaxID=63459 RepID=A0A803L0P7_CHEQI
MNSMISKWFPKAERARAVRIAMDGFQLGSAIGLILSPVLMSNAERSPQIFVYELKYILTKRQQSAPSNAGKAHKARVIPPFKRLLSKLPTWSLMIANAMHSWGFFVILSWMPLYFNSVYHVDLRQAAWFSAVPWSMMALVGYFGGSWSDTLIQRGFSITFTRKIMQSIGFIGPGIALIGMTTATSPSIASAWLTLAVGLKSFSHSGFLVNIQGVTLVCLSVAFTASA